MFRQLHEVQPPAWRAFAFVLVAAVAVRVAWGLVAPTPIAALPDQGEYLEIAQNVLGGRGFVLVDERYAIEQTLRAQRMPGYPLFVAMLGAEPAVVRVVQALVEASTALAAFLIAWRMGCGRWSIVAAIGVAMHPYLAYFSTLVLTETLFTALLAWGVWALLARRWWVAAALMVAATYLRPSGAVLWLAMVLVRSGVGDSPASGPDPRQASRLPHKHVGPMFWAMLVLGIGLSPWIIRNALVLGAFVPTTTNGGITLYDGWNLDNTAGGSDQSFVRFMPELSLMGEVERSRYLRHKAVEAAQRDPWRTAELGFRKVARTWSPVPLSDGRLTVRIVGGVFVVSLFLLALLGLARGPGGFTKKALLLTPIVVLTLLHAASVGSMRYRLPIDPLLCVLAAGGVAFLTTRWRRRSYETVA